MKALIVDDDEDMRGLVRLLFELEDDIEVVGEAGDAASGARCWAEQRPDVVVVDFRLPEGDGLDLAEWILAEDPGVCILLFSAFIDDATAARARQVGVRELVGKERYGDLLGFARAHTAPAVPVTPAHT
jgi:DNA-binding NarL/FixJ family response regulator